jgi:hypothetical protein
MPIYILIKDNDYKITKNQEDSWFRSYYKDSEIARTKALDQARKAIYLDRKKRFDIQEFIGPEHFVEKN